MSRELITQAAAAGLNLSRVNVAGRGAKSYRFFIRDSSNNLMFDGCSLDEGEVKDFLEKREK